MHRAMLRSAALLGLAVLGGCNRATPPPAARPAQAQTKPTGSILTSATNSTRPAAAPNQSDTANTDATNIDAANTNNTGNKVLLGSPELTAGSPGKGPLEISEIRAWLEVVEWYAKGGHPNPHLSSKIKKLDLIEQDKKDLVEFMKACTGDLPRVDRGRLPK